MRTLHPKPFVSDIDTERVIRCVTCNSVCGVLFQCGGRLFYYQRHGGRESLTEGIPNLIRCRCGTVWDNISYPNVIVIDRLPPNVKLDIPARIYHFGHGVLGRAEQGEVAPLVQNLSAPSSS